MEEVKKIAEIFTRIVKPVTLYNRKYTASYLTAHLYSNRRYSQHIECFRLHSPLTIIC